MRAIGLTRHGAPEVLHTLNLPEPHAGEGEVRIRVRAAGVNPVDAIIRAGEFVGIEADAVHPVVPGMDVAGVLDEVGPAQPDGFDLVVGDPVVGFVVPSGLHGGYSEQIVLPTLSITRAPSNVDHAAAAAFLSNALTAEICLEALDLPRGSTLAITGAAGGVGGYLIELAAARGLVVIADAAPEDEDLVRRLGASHVARRGDHFVADVLDLTDGRGADALGDAAILAGAVLPAVRHGGQIAFFLQNDVEPGRDITAFRSYVMKSSTRHDVIERLTRLVEAEQLTIRVARAYPATDAVGAHLRLGRGHLRGRLVLEL